MVISCLWHYVLPHTQVQASMVTLLISAKNVQILCKMSVCDYLMDVFGMILIQCDMFWKDCEKDMSLSILSLRMFWCF
ncbi:unnamed protein product [Trifolium pratense]|uniref:Uncharacterized protein n=1 Tax=Trifolium pratense TaxID=57577 RepID=A0ACB0J6V0_TRIPR|nr:unnamed protein product [Trifolium pratense]